MNLSKDAFVYKLYVACWLITKKLQGKDRGDIGREFLDYDDEPRVGDTLNLCPLMRTIFVWAPLYFLLVSILVAGFAFVLFYLPYTFGGIVGYANTYVIPGIFVGVILGIIFGYPFLTNYLGDKLEDLDNRFDERKLEKAKRRAEGKYTILELIWKYIVSTKQKICPIITVIKKDDQS